MDILLFAPSRALQQNILKHISHDASVKNVHNFNSLLDQLENNFFKAVVLAPDSGSDSAFENLIHTMRSYAPDVPIFFTKSKISKNLEDKLKNYRIFVLENSIEGLNELNKFLNHFLNFGSPEADKSQTDQIYIAEDPLIRSILDTIELIKNQNVNLLITGETGTGKTMLARYIHARSNRKKFPFMHLNCAAIPDSLLESELFGFKKGTFTGAVRDKDGKFKAAGRGTICLDEIGEIKLHLQAKLLKVLDEKLYYPLGESTPVRVKARVIAATNKHLEEAIKEKKFRHDLYYRLNTVTINIPALRETREIIPKLFDHFITQYSKSNKANRPEIDRGVYEVLKTYSWPGNIRELQSTAISILYQNLKKIKIEHLPEQLFKNPESVVFRAADQLKSLEEVKRDYAHYVYHKLNKQKLKTARALDIDIKTLRRMLESSS